MVCIFCDFIEGKSNNYDKLSFLRLHETPNTLSFLSIGVPEKEDGHILVVPKKHFDNIEDIPLYIRHELIDHATFASKVTRKLHDGCSIIFNNTSTSDSLTLHSHIHIVPKPKSVSNKEILNPQNSTDSNNGLDGHEYIALTNLYKERLNKLL